jgi:integrase
MAVNPTAGIQLPAVRGKRERTASPTEAAQLIAALPQRDRAIWATAPYAGLRSAELQALTDELVDLESDRSGSSGAGTSWQAEWPPRAAPAAARCPSPAPSASTGSSTASLAAAAGGLIFGRPNGRRSRISRSASALRGRASRWPRSDRRLHDDRVHQSRLAASCGGDQMHRNAAGGGGRGRRRGLGRLSSLSLLRSRANLAGSFRREARRYGAWSFPGVRFLAVVSRGSS